MKRRHAVTAVIGSHGVGDRIGYGSSGFARVRCDACGNEYLVAFAFSAFGTCSLRTGQPRISWGVQGFELLYRDTMKEAAKC